MNRQFIGIEIDEKYFQIAERRINQAQPPLPLFSNTSSRAEASPLLFT